MSRRLALVVVAGLLAACGTASVAVKPDFDFAKVRRVAVMGFKDYPRRRGSGQILTGAFERGLLNVGYELVEREQVDKLLRERKLTAADPRAAKEVGRILGVDALLLGSITDFREPKDQLTHVDVVDTHQDPVYVRRTRVVEQGGVQTEVQEDVIEGYQTNRVVRREPRTVTVDGRLGVSARLVFVADGTVLWTGSDAVRVWTFEDAARNVSESILKAVKATWPANLKR